ncbi:MAG: transporter substrate-binding domain-containing protein [Desulforegulaceae bacterium]|nr:transporter substrate-binding domain-containing protein [Desulforegulaceae bacterium]
MKKNIMKFAVSALVIAGVLFAGCSKKEEDKKELTQFDKIKKKGQITIGTSPDYPPFESIDDDGNIVGFDIDLAKEIAKELGVEAKFVSMGFDSIITAVKNGQTDMGMSSFSVNEERKMSIDFSKPYISTAQVILVNKDSAITKAEDLEKSSVAVQMGTTGAEAAKELKDVDVKTVEDYNVATMMLDNGVVRAVILDIAIAKELASRHSFRVLETPLNQEETAIVIRKGNDDLKQSVDNAIDKIMADGRYDQIKTKWDVK